MVLLDIAVVVLCGLFGYAARAQYIQTRHLLALRREVLALRTQQDAMGVSLFDMKVQCRNALCEGLIRQTKTRQAVKHLGKSQAEFFAQLAIMEIEEVELDEPTELSVQGQGVKPVEAQCDCGEECPCPCAPVVHDDETSTGHLRPPSPASLSPPPAGEALATFVAPTVHIEDCTAADLKVV
jgi:hypothetical protein